MMKGIAAAIGPRRVAESGLQAEKDLNRGVLVCREKIRLVDRAMNADIFAAHQDALIGAQRRRKFRRSGGSACDIDVVRGFGHSRGANGGGVACTHPLAPSA